MEKTVSQVEKNVSASFGYVKKDMLMLNDAFSDLHDKMQHLSLNHANLMGEIQRIREKIAKLEGKKIPVKKIAPVKKNDNGKKKKVEKKSSKKKTTKTVKNSPAKKSGKKSPVKKKVVETTVYR